MEETNVKKLSRKLNFRPKAFHYMSFCIKTASGKMVLNSC